MEHRQPTCHGCNFAGTLHCWASTSRPDVYNAAGQATVPANLRSARIVKVTAFFESTCALSGDGELACFGRTNVPEEFRTGVADVSEPSWGSTCIVTLAGAVRCWGASANSVPSDLGSGAAKVCALGRFGNA